MRKDWRPVKVWYLSRLPRSLRKCIHWASENESSICRISLNFRPEHTRTYQNYSMWHKELLPTDSNPSQYKSSKFIMTWITICRSVGSSLFVPSKPSFSTHMTNFMETFPNHNSQRDHSLVILFGLDWSHKHPPSNPFICVHLSWPNAGSFWKDHSYNLAKSWPIVHPYMSCRSYLNIIYKRLSYHTPVCLKTKGRLIQNLFPIQLAISWLFMAFLGGGDPDTLRWVNPTWTYFKAPFPLMSWHFLERFCCNHCCWGTFRTHQRCTQDAPDNQTWLQRVVLLFNWCQKGWWGVSP